MPEREINSSSSNLLEEERMDTVKKPEMLMSSMSLMISVGTSIYFNKRIETIAERESNLEDHVASVIKQTEETKKYGEQFYKVAEVVKDLCKSNNDIIQQLNSYKSLLTERDKYIIAQGQKIAQLENMLNETLKVIRNSNPQLSSVPSLSLQSQVQNQVQQQQPQQFNSIPTPQQPISQQNQVQQQPQMQQQPIPQTVSQQNQVQQQPQMQQQFTFPPLTQNGIYSSQSGNVESDFNPSSLSTTNIVEDKNKDEDDDVAVEAALKAMKQRKLALII